MRAKIVVPPADIERAYNNNIEQYSTPEQVRASHILLKTEGKDDAAVKAKAEELLKQAKAGADFAELAKKNSEDEASAKNGGDLDYFGRGRMVPEFDQVAFALQPGRSAISSRRSTATTSSSWSTRRPATTRPLAEVRQQITDQLAYERAQAQAADLAQTLEQADQQAGRPRQGGQGAGAHRPGVGLLRARRADARRSGPSPEAAARAFEMKPGEVAGPLRASRGFVVRDARRASRIPYVPKLDEVKDRVRDEVVKQKARELSKQKAAELAAKLKSGARLREGGQGGRRRGQDHRAHRARLADSRSGRRAGGRRSGVQAAGRRGQRSDRDRQRHGGHQGAREEGSDAGRVDDVEGHVPRGAARRSPQPLLQRLHGEGEAEDEDRSEPRGAAARGQLNGYGG